MQQEKIEASFADKDTKNAPRIRLGLRTDPFTGRHTGVFLGIEEKELTMDAKNAELLAYQLSRFAMYFSLIQEHGILDTTSPAGRAENGQSNG